MLIQRKLPPCLSYWLDRDERGCEKLINSTNHTPKVEQRVKTPEKLKWMAKVEDDPASFWGFS